MSDESLVLNYVRCKLMRRKVNIRENVQKIKAWAIIQQGLIHTKLRPTPSPPPPPLAPVLPPQQLQLYILTLQGTLPKTKKTKPKKQQPRKQTITPPKKKEQKKVCVREKNKQKIRTATTKQTKKHPCLHATLTSVK